MKQIIFADEVQRDLQLTKTTANPDTLVLPAGDYPTVRDRANELSKRAPSFSYVNDVLMTAAIGETPSDVVAVYNNRLKRG